MKHKESIKQIVKLLANEGQNQQARPLAPGQRSENPGPSEAKARQSVQLFCDPKATFFGDFLFCQKRKLPPPGRRSTPKIQNQQAKDTATQKASTCTASQVVNFKDEICQSRTYYVLLML
ncbi:hypothetical protein [Polaromonas sp.]|uniref:hypothetical protein n=1 Tax=Polaromonas sp. TaxID=1869339 RepID=UPI0025E65B27|nr:hypothetical protein [Polaromonas sp.]